MKLYTIPVVWQMMGTVVVAADSLEDAIADALDGPTPLPTNGSYIEESCAVDDSVHDDYTGPGSGEDDLADYNQNEAADYCNE
jgi:hypothetical protein